MKCKNCNKNEEDLIYYGKPICLKCFHKHSVGEIDLKILLKITEKERLNI